MMVRIVFVLVGLLGICSAHGAGASDPAMGATVLWKLGLDAQGHVVALEPKSEANEVLLQKLEGVVRKWAFEPGTVNGKPAATETTLRLAVQFESVGVGDSFRIRLKSASTGGSLDKIGKAPSLRSAEWRGIPKTGKRVELLVKYDAEGTVVEASAWKDSPLQKGPLVESAVRAVRTWKYSPERVGGIGIPSEVVQPICFGTCTDEVAKDDSASNDDSRLAMDSRVRLKSDVVDSIL